MDSPDVDAPLAANGPHRSWLADFPPSRRLLTVFAVATVLVYAAGVTSHWFPIADGAVYVTLGRSLAEGHGYRFNGEVNTAVTPGLPAILAGLERLFGGSYWAPNILMALCGLGAIYLAYRVLAELSDRRVALLVAAITAFSFRYHSFSHRILTDMPFALLFWVCLYGALRFCRGGGRRWVAVLAATSVAAIVLRAPGALALGPLGLGLMLDRSVTPRLKRRLVCGSAILAGTGAAAGAMYLLVVLVVQKPMLYVQVAHSAMDPMKLPRAWLAGLWNFQSVLADAMAALNGFAPLGIILLALVAAGCAGLWKRGQRMVPVVIAAYPLALATTGGGDYVLVRYLLPILPLLAYAMLEGAFMATRWVLARRPAKAPAALSSRLARWRRLLPSDPYLCVASLVTVLAIALNAPRLIHDTAVYGLADAFSNRADLVSSLHIVRDRDSRSEDVANVVDILRRRCPATGLFAVPSHEASILLYLSRRRAWAYPDDFLSPRKVAESIGLDPNVRVVVLNMRDAGNAARAEANEVFGNRGAELSYTSRRYWVYDLKPSGAAP